MYNGRIQSEVLLLKGKKLLLTMFMTFLKIGLFTFGGGYAMISLIENEFVEKKKWIDKEEFLNMAAIAESTPGPIAINAATYIGHRVSGITGAVLATVAVCIPSFFIIYVISLFFDSFLKLEYVTYAFKGVQICVIYLIFSAGIKLFKGMKKSPFNIAIFICVCASMLLASFFAVKLSTVYYILICGIVGMAVSLLSQLKNKEKEEK